MRWRNGWRWDENKANLRIDFFKRTSYIGKEGPAKTFEMEMTTGGR